MKSLLIDHEIPLCTEVHETLVQVTAEEGPARLLFAMELSNIAHGFATIADNAEAREKFDRHDALQIKNRTHSERLEATVAYGRAGDTGLGANPYEADIVGNRTRGHQAEPGSNPCRAAKNIP